MPVCEERRFAAHFSAVRERALERLFRRSTAWRFVWYVPFDAAAIGALLEDRAFARLAAQLATLGLSSAAAFATRRRPHAARHGLWLAMLHYWVGVANTGGLSSPLLPAGLPMLVIAGLVFERRSERAAFACAAVAALVALGALTGSSVVATPRAFFADGALTAAGAALLVVTGAVAMVGLHHAGRGVTRAFTEVAFELATRQEEICSDGEDLGRSLEEMAARVAHEVKNPLASIKALAALEAKRAADPESAERLGVIGREADRLRDVVDGFLSFSKQPTALRVAPVRPFDVAREIAVLVEGRAAETHVSVEACGDDGLTLVADGRKLRQALLNLVLNAMQAARAGQSVRVAVDRVGEQARIRVIDRGEGMCAEVLERTRRPYFSTREGGSGLGLAVARGIVAQHGGALELASAPGEGTTATIWLPLEAARGADLARLPLVRPA